MASVRPTVASHAPRASPNTYITTCKLCGRGIYQGQEHRWLSDPIGFSHDDCVRRAAQGRADADAHRLADVAHQLAARVREDEPDAVARWLCGELDGLERWRLLFMLAAMVPTDRTPADLLAWFWERRRGGVVS